MLAERLCARPPAGARVVELGCGVGLPAVVAALGGADVVATDWYPEALAFTRANATAAGARGRDHGGGLAPAARRALRPRARPTWSWAPTCSTRSATGAALAALLPRLLPPGGEALIADPRRPHAAALIEPLRRGRLGPRAPDVRSRGRPDESGPVIHLHRLRRTPGLTRFEDAAAACGYTGRERSSVAQW